MKLHGISLAIFITCVTIQYSFAQKDTLITYLNYNLKKTSKEKAVAVSVAVRKDSTWDILSYHISTQRKISHIYARDAHGIKLHGSYAVYYPDGYAKQVSGWYNNGKRTGIWLSWDIDGTLTDSILYENGVTIMRASFSTRWGQVVAKDPQARGRADATDRAFKYVEIVDFKDRSSKMYKYTSEGTLLYKYEKRDDVEEFRHYYKNGQVARYVKKKNYKTVEEACYSVTGTKEKDCTRILSDMMGDVVPEFPAELGSVENASL